MSIVLFLVARVSLALKKYYVVCAQNKLDKMDRRRRKEKIGNSRGEGGEGFFAGDEGGSKR